jgi:hypothetical protein
VLQPQAVLLDLGTRDGRSAVEAIGAAIAVADELEWSEVARGHKTAPAPSARRSAPKRTSPKPAACVAERVTSSAAVRASASTVEPRAHPGGLGLASAVGARGAWQQRPRAAGPTIGATDGHSADPQPSSPPRKAAGVGNGNTDGDAEAERDDCACAELADALRMLHPRAASELALSWRNV